MVTFRYDGPPLKLPALQGRVIMDVAQGRLRVRKWPRRQKKPRTARQAETRVWFEQANHLAKLANARDQVMSRELAHGGPLLPRDLLVSCMAGRFLTIATMQDGVWYSMAAIRDVSEVLDAIGQLPGQVLVRGPMLWMPAGPAPAGHVLTSQGEGQPAAFASAAGSGFPWHPPALEAFPTWINQLDATAANDQVGIFAITSPPGPTAINMRARVRPLKSPPHLYRGLFSIGTYGTAGLSGGITIADSTTGRLLRYHFRSQDNSQHLTLRLDRFDTPTSVDGTTFNMNVVMPLPAYLAIEDDGSNFTFLAGPSSAAMLPVLQQSRTAWLNDPALIGIGLFVNATTTIGAQVACWDWHEAQL